MSWRERVTVGQEALDFWAKSSAEWTAEASGLGLRPGEWPLQIVVSLGDEAVSFGRAQALGLPADPNGYRYQTEGGARSLTVWND
jgi:hypothetical protein